MERTPKSQWTPPIHLKKRVTRVKLRKEWLLVTVSKQKIMQEKSVLLWQACVFASLFGMEIRRIMCFLLTVEAGFMVHQRTVAILATGCGS